MLQGGGRGFFFCLTSTALVSSLAVLLLWFVDLEVNRARVFWMQRLSCGLQRMLLLLGCSGPISSCLSIAVEQETQGSINQINSEFP